MNKRTLRSWSITGHHRLLPRLWDRIRFVSDQDDPEGAREAFRQWFVGEYSEGYDTELIDPSDVVISEVEREDVTLILSME